MNFKSEENMKEAVKKMYELKQYSLEELEKLRHTREGNTCICKIKIMNTMTMECPICGKIFLEFAKR